MKILVTGGAGFIGSHVAEAMLADGHEVHIADDLSTGKLENLPAKAAFFKVDLSDTLAVEKLMREGKYQLISHHAAQLDVRKSVADPVFDAKVNIIGTLNLIEQGLKYGLKKIIFASSGGTVYGEQIEFPATESHLLKPVSPYGVAKLSVEHYLHYYHVIFGLQYICLRYANVYGPRQNPHGEAGVVAIFANKMLAHEQTFINGDGLQTRDYVFVEDVVRANLLSISHTNSEAFNIGTGIETTVIQLYDLIQIELGGDKEKVFAAAKEGEQIRSVLDYGKIKKALGWEPKHSLKSGMNLTLEWFKKQKTTA